MGLAGVRRRICARFGLIALLAVNQALCLVDRREVAGPLDCNLQVLEGVIEFAGFGVAPRALLVGIRKVVGLKPAVLNGGRKLVNCAAVIAGLEGIQTLFVRSVAILRRATAAEARRPTATKAESRHEKHDPMHTIPFRLESQAGLVRIGLIAVSRTQCPPGAQIDAAGEEVDGAVAVKGIHAAGMQALRRDDRVLTRRVRDRASIAAIESFPIGRSEVIVHRGAVDSERPTIGEV